MADSRNKARPDPAELIESVAGVLAAAQVGRHTRVGVALSGGVDSVVLLHALAAVRPRFDFQLSAVHVHHGLSPNADSWRNFCAGLCVSLDVPFSACEVAVPRAHPDGLEAAARAARHAALARADVDWLAFGHHQDDQAETVLFRLLRGTGVHGAGAMAAMEPGTPGKLRPLLEIRRGEIAAYASATGLAWIEDESNVDQDFSRNHLRHAVFPLLAKAFPAAVPMLARAAANFREADCLLDELAENDWTACGGDELRLSALLLRSDARIRNVLRWRIRVMGAEAPARARLFEAVRQIRASSGHPLYLPLGDAACGVYRDQVWLERGVIDEPHTAVWKGETCLPWADGRVRFEREPGAGLRLAALEAATEVVVTARWDGLRMSPGRGRPRRSFKKLCQEAGIPGWLRSRMPVLRVDGEPVWIAGIGCAGEYACPRDEPGIVPAWERTSPA